MRRARSHTFADSCRFCGPPDRYAPTPKICIRLNLYTASHALLFSLFVTYIQSPNNPRTDALTCCIEFPPKARHQTTQIYCAAPARILASVRKALAALFFPMDTLCFRATSLKLACKRPKVVVVEVLLAIGLTLHGHCGLVLEVAARLRSQQELLASALPRTALCSGLFLLAGCAFRWPFKPPRDVVICEYSTQPKIAVSSGRVGELAIGKAGIVAFSENSLAPKWHFGSRESYL